ncbi:uncharacterized protein UDID_08900 [Ustilago sp. UG-2017a]|nr:uncharacterized protein UDID_08900 [Ustilago sp. UG-2017a]
MPFCISALIATLITLACTLVGAQSLPELTPRQLAVHQLVNASRILAYQGIADDSLGHISVRDPLAPDTSYLVTGGSSSAAHVTPADIAIVRINDSVITSAALSDYGPPLRPAEIFIHSSIYQRFPNTTVSSVAFYRSEQLLPWSLYNTNTSSLISSSVTAADLTAFFAATSGTAFMGPHPAPVFDVFDAEPSTTSVAVDNTVKGFGLAQKFGPANASVQTINQTDGFRPLVLMRNDGATVVGTTVPETVYRFVQAAKSARVQYHASSLASVSGSVPQFLPDQATKTTDQYLPSWLLWMSQIEPSINADSTRSPELWKGDGTTSPASAHSNGQAIQLPFKSSASMLPVCAALILAAML